MTAELADTSGYAGIHEVLLIRGGQVERVEIRYRPDENGQVPCHHPGLHEAIYQLLDGWGS